MKFLFAATSLALLVIVQYSSAASTWSPLIDIKECHGKPDGTFVPDEKDKHVYYECNNGLAGKFHCPSDLIFDTKLNSCGFDPNGPTRAPVTGPTSPKCHGKPDGFYPDANPNAKTRYYECFRGFAYEFQCPPTTVFIPSLQHCDRDPDQNNNNHHQPTVAPPVVITTQQHPVTHAPIHEVTQHATVKEHTVPHFTRDSTEPTRGRHTEHF